MRLLTKAIRGLTEREEAIVLAFLLERALIPTAPRPQPLSIAEPTSPATVEFSAEAGRAGDFMRWPRIGALLLLYQAAAEVPAAKLASELSLELDVLYRIFADLSMRLAQAQHLGAVFGELAQGHTLRQAAKNLAIPVEELVGELRPSAKLVQAVSSAIIARTALPGPPVPHVGYSVRGPLRTMPVRLPEEHYQRLKEWSEAHNFPMAVVVRGLVERFLDDQESRPA